jgi:hypothetical protein
MTNNIPTLEFTFDWYERFLRAAKAGIPGRFLRFTDSDESSGLFLRHDIDYSPRKARRMALIESDLGISATYFFLLTTPLYNVFEPTVRDAIAEICEHGHDIALHFSTHAYFEESPSLAELCGRIEQEQESFSAMFDQVVDVVSFHNPPGWILDEDLPGVISTYAPQFFSEIDYAADSNQRWRDEFPFQEGLPARAQLLVHPVLWGDSDASTVDRLREERDTIYSRIDTRIESENRIWVGSRGLDSEVGFERS